MVLVGIMGVVAFYDYSYWFYFLASNSRNLLQIVRRVQCLILPVDPIKWLLYFGL